MRGTPTRSVSSPPLRTPPHGALWRHPAGRQGVDREPPTSSGPQPTVHGAIDAQRAAAAASRAASPVVHPVARHPSPPPPPPPLTRRWRIRRGRGRAPPRRPRRQPPGGRAGVRAARARSAVAATQPPAAGPVSTGVWGGPGVTLPTIHAQQSRRRRHHVVRCASAALPTQYRPRGPTCPRSRRSCQWPGEGAVQGGSPCGRL